jgi:hypothetical protein
MVSLVQESSWWLLTTVCKMETHWPSGQS